MAEHRRIWQMQLLNQHAFARFCDERGLTGFREESIIQLWQLGLLKADLIECDEEFTIAGLVDRGIDRYGRHIYSDERQLQQRPDGLGDALKTLQPLRDDVGLLFHPFRFYVLYHLNNVLGLHISKMQIFYQEGYPRLINSSLSSFNHWTGSEQFVSRVRMWNDTASLVIVTEPSTYVRIFHSIRYDPFEVENFQTGAEEISKHIEEYWNGVNELYQKIGVKRLEELRFELCIATQMLDPNRWIHTLLCLGESKLRLELEGRLGGALLLRTMAEMLRRASEKAFDTKLREEDEIGFGEVPEAVKETLYGSNRLLDDLQAAGEFAKRHGLSYRPHVHMYGEGATEQGAIHCFFKLMGISVPVTNLHGLIKERNSMATFFRDSLRSDIKAQMCSIVVIDGDARDRENVRILERAARDNQIVDDDGIFGRFFLSKPDFEFENFEGGELEEVLWKWAGEKNPSQADREVLHSHVQGATNSSEFFTGVQHAAQSLPQLYRYDKCEEWGEELMKYALKHPYKQGKKRLILQALEVALHWEKPNLERYEIGKKTYMVDPKTGELVNRS